MHSSSAPVQKALDPRVMGTRSIVPSSISRGESLKSECDESLHSEHDQSLISEHDESLSPEHDESLEPEPTFSSFGGTQGIESDIGRPTKRTKIIRHPDAEQFEMTIPYIL
jgi:hypothetical protein